MEELSQREMRETEGAFLGMFVDMTATQAAIVGAGTNAITYTIKTKGHGDAREAIVAAGVGAMTGGTQNLTRSAGLISESYAVGLSNAIYQYFSGQQSMLDSIER